MAGIRCCINEQDSEHCRLQIVDCRLICNLQSAICNGVYMARTTDDILAAVKDQQVEFISLQFTDIIGMVKNVTIPVAQLTDCLDHGVWFDGSAIEGFARIAESDMFLVPD